MMALYSDRSAILRKLNFTEWTLGTLMWGPEDNGEGLALHLHQRSGQCQAQTAEHLLADPAGVASVEDLSSLGDSSCFTELVCSWCQLGRGMNNRPGLWLGSPGSCLLFLFPDAALSLPAIV